MCVQTSDRNLGEMTLLRTLTLSWLLPRIPYAGSERGFQGGAPVSSRIQQGFSLILTLVSLLCLREKQQFTRKPHGISSASGGAHMGSLLWK